ncbi:hypothetical protein WM40_00400 [Robbsia andropogonis]|uniref:Uncharacterized protein n=1 Tax=Robbsia andropogonis TaxID=28092 RepID=A0A0F5K5N5_9BURK|nr:hypothetical protein WM40_00400 [Robbsia andropogonis]
MAALESADQNRVSNEVSTALSLFDFDDTPGALNDRKYAIGGADDAVVGLAPDHAADDDADLRTIGLPEPTVDALIDMMIGADSHVIPRPSPDVDLRARIRTGVDEAGNAAPASTSSRYASYPIMLFCLHTSLETISQEMNDVTALCSEKIEQYKTARVARYEAHQTDSKPGLKAPLADAPGTDGDMLARRKTCRDMLQGARKALESTVQKASSILPLTVVFPKDRGDAKRNEAPRSPPAIRLKPGRQVTVKRTFSFPIGTSIRQKDRPLREDTRVSMDDLPARFYKPVVTTRSVTVLRTADDQRDLNGNADVREVMKHFKLTTSYPDLEKSEE